MLVPSQPTVSKYLLAAAFFVAAFFVTIFPWSVVGARPRYGAPPLLSLLQSGTSASTGPRNKRIESSASSVEIIPGLTRCAVLSSDCSSCISHPHCRFCLLKPEKQTGFILQQLGNGSEFMAGNCIDMRTSTWHEAATTPDVKGAVCGLLIPDFVNGLTCFDAEAGAASSEYRHILEQLHQPFALQGSAGSASSDEKPTLLQSLEHAEDPLPQRSPEDVFLYVIVVPLLGLAACGCCTALMLRGCKLRYLCCGPCLCCARLLKSAARGTSQVAKELTPSSRRVAAAASGMDAFHTYYLKNACQPPPHPIYAAAGDLRFPLNSTAGSLSSTRPSLAQSFGSAESVVVPLAQQPAVLLQQLPPYVQQQPVQTATTEDEETKVLRDALCNRQRYASKD